MNSITKKLLSLIMLMVLVIAVAACDQFTTTQTTTATTTTTSASTVTTTSQPNSTTTETSTFTTTQTTTQTTSIMTTTESSVTTTTGKYLGIQVVDITKTEYNLGESFDPATITVLLLKNNGTALPLGPSVYQTSGFSSSIAGEKTVTVTYDIYQTTFTIMVLPNSTGLYITMPYYESAEGLMGEVLVLELNEILNQGFISHSYSSASYKLDETDEDPAIPGNVILVYSGYSVSGVWDAGATWNKEHVWPQSLLGDDAEMVADIHNLKPANPSFNQDRSNKYYSESSTLVSYEPRDEVKGDVARILFYMVVMYYPVLELVDTAPMTYQMGLLSVLLDWHELDPVDDFERNRNDEIYEYQNNRNPFIDYPEFVDLIWDNLG
ncbi:MAG: endonuclease [Bacilli bacterium]|nr:endonuclease [Bacilli bacterium]